MPQLSTKTKKYLRYGLSGLLVTGMILVTGFLSFTGMLVLNDSIYLALGAFFLAGVIEGEIYAQYINRSLLKIFTGDYLEDAILNKKLDKLIKRKASLDALRAFSGEVAAAPEDNFLSDYKKLLDYEAELEENHHDEGYSLRPSSTLLSSGKPKPNQFYFEYDSKEQKLKYTVLNPQGQKVEGSLGEAELKLIGADHNDVFMSALQKQPGPDLKILKRFLPDLLVFTSKLGHTHLDRETELKNTRRSLKLMRQTFKKFMMKNEQLPEGDAAYYADLQAITAAEKTALRKEIRKKIWQSRLSWVLNLGAGLSCGLVGLQVAQASILAVTAHFGLAISGAALSGSVFGLAMVGAVGYTLLVHNTISDMIQNSTLQKWAQKTRHFFAPRVYTLAEKLDNNALAEKNTVYYKKEGDKLWFALNDSFGKLTGVITQTELEAYNKNHSAAPLNLDAPTLDSLLSFISEKDGHRRVKREPRLRYYFRIFFGALAVGAIVGLGIFATVATAGTWWYAAKAGAKLVSWLADSASALRTVAVSLMGITTLAFNIVNSLKSAKEIAETSLHEIWHRITDKIKAYKNSEHLVQFINPLRFIIEAISVPFKLLTFIGHVLSMGIMSDNLEGVNPHLTAGAAATSEGITDFNIIFPEEGHDHAGHTHQPAQAKPQHKHKHHDHSHADLAGLFLKLALFPLYFLAAAWDYAASRLNKTEEGWLTARQALKKSFSGLAKHHVVHKPEMSNSWRKIEKGLRIEKAITKRQKEVLKEGGSAAVNLLRDRILTPDAPPETAFFEDPKKNAKATEKVLRKLFRIAVHPDYLPHTNTTPTLIR